MEEADVSNTKITAYPLVWPEGWKRTTSRKRSAPYKVSFHQAYEDARNSLSLFKGYGVVVSTDVPLRRDGHPYADGDPRDPGVAIYFTRAQQQYVIACDLYDKVHWNMRAVGLAIDGMRAIERSGASHILDRAVAGFAQLGSGAGTAPSKRPWREVLNLEGLVGPGFAVIAAVEASYKSLARTRHPDAGGSHDAMTELNAARDEALQEIGNA
jgi:hypothetical protein